jgi:hypothetical protein
MDTAAGRENSRPVGPDSSVRIETSTSVSRCGVRVGPSRLQRARLHRESFPSLTQHLRRYTISKMMVYLERVLRSPKKAEDIQSEHAKLRTAVCDASQGPYAAFSLVTRAPLSNIGLAPGNSCAPRLEAIRGTRTTVHVARNRFNGVERVIARGVRSISSPASRSNSTCLKKDRCNE